MSGATITFPGGTMYDGKQMTTGDQSGAVVYQLNKFAVTGNTPLTGASSN